MSTPGAAIEALARITRANAAAERRHARPAYLDIEEANRRDARLAGELTSSPVSTSTGTRFQPWEHPTTSGDEA